MADQVEGGRAPSSAEADFVLTTLENSVQAVIELNNNRDRSVPISKALLDFVDQLMPPRTPQEPDDDKCEDPDPITKPLCSALKLAEAQANSNFGGAENSAAGNMYAAVNAWTLAVSTYESAVEDASATLDVAIEAAKTTYFSAMKAKPDSPSRALLLWYTLKAATVEAVQTYEASGVICRFSCLGGGHDAGGLHNICFCYLCSGVNARIRPEQCESDVWRGVEAGRAS